MEVLHSNDNIVDDPLHVSTNNNIDNNDILYPASPASSPQPVKTTTEYNKMNHSSSFQTSLHHHLEQTNQSSSSQLLKEIVESYLEREKKDLQLDPNNELLSLEKDWMDRKNGIYQTVIPKEKLNNKNNKNGNGSFDSSPSIIFWQQFIDHQNYKAVLKEINHEVWVNELQTNGIPDEIRGLVWQIMTRSNSTYLQQHYQQLSSTSLDTFSKYAQDIDQDIKKSFGFRYSQNALDAMGRILKAYTIYNTQFVYTTSSLFILLPLLKHTSESQAFCLFVKLMELGDIANLLPSFKMESQQKQQQLYIKVFDILLAQYCPQLVIHLNAHHVHTKTYVSQWYQTFFTTNLPDKIIDRFYDLIFTFGSLEIISRAGIALLSRSEPNLLKLTGSESFILTLCTRKLYDMGYDDNDDNNDLIIDILHLGSTITRDRLMDACNQLILLDQQQQQQKVATKTNPDEKKKLKRESWFPSWSNSNETTATHPNNEQFKQEQEQQDEEINKNPLLSIIKEGKKEDGGGGDHTTVLHQQIEDLVCALSQLQKEHAHLSQEMMMMKARDMDTQMEQAKLQKRNNSLEKKVKKYKLKLSEQQQQQSVIDHQDENYRSFVDSLRLSGQFGALVAGALINEPTTTTTKPSSAQKQSKQKRQSLKTILDDESLTTTTTTQQQQVDPHRHSQSSSSGREEIIEEDEEGEELVNEGLHHDDTTIVNKKRESTNNNNSNNNNKNNLDNVDYEKQTAALHSITSELVSVKLANFEMGQKYEQLFNKYNDMEQLYTKSKQQLSAQSLQLEELERTIEHISQDRDHFLEEQVHLWSEEQETLLQENEDWMEKALAAKNTAKELHLDKLGLMKQVERLERRIDELETEKREYLLPTSSFTDEVFSTHKFLFGGQNNASSTSTASNDKVNEEYIKTIEEYRTKYVDTDLRCRELEKLLAEAKVKIAEYEAFNSSSMSTCSTTSSSICCSPRSSLQQRASFTLQMKRASVASYMTNSSHPPRHSISTTTMDAFRMNTPTSPTTPNHETSLLMMSSNNRLSNESCASSTTSSATSMGSLNNNNNNQHQQQHQPINKRASMYAKICSTFGMNTAPTSYNTTDISTTMKDSIVYDEPQPI